MSSSSKKREASKWARKEDLTSPRPVLLPVANDGQEALDVIQRTSEEGAQQFDVVLLDVEMPRVSRCFFLVRVVEAERS